jgi:hypothetical protein
MSAVERVILEKDSLETERVIVEIIDVTYRGGYRLEIVFQDNTRHQIDFEPFLRNAKNSDIRDYLDIEKFKSYRIEHGDLVWDDLELCFPIMDLYEGRIS